RVPKAFLAVHRIEGAVAFLVELHVVEDEELGFGAEHGGIGQAGALEEFLGFLGDAARVAVVGFLGAGLGDGAGQRERGHGAGGVDESRGGVGHGQHVGGLDGFPAADGGTVEAEAVGERVLGQFGGGNAEVLPGAEGVDELDVDHFGALVFGQVDGGLGSAGFAAAHGVVGIGGG